MIQNQTIKKAVSHPISKLVRPLFEKKKIKSAFGGFFLITTLATGLFFLQGDISLIEASYSPFTDDISIETKLTFSKVLPGMSGASQEYQPGHTGLDLTAPLGSKIVPLKKGRVVAVGTENTGYGRYVEVDHGENLVTLYAHMGKIQVEEGEIVDIDRALGEVGLTGRTTGPHLHFEVHQNGSSVNPRTYLHSLPKGRRK